MQENARIGMKTELASICSETIAGRQHASPGVVDEILASVFETASLVEATWHPLGFMRLKLASTPQGTLRIHIWPAKDREFQSPLWNIHDHLFDVHSLILCGALENRRFAVRSDDTRATNRLYRVSYGENHSHLQATANSVSCRQLSSDQYSALDSYEISRGEFHASVVKEGILAATIVVTSNHSERPPTVLGDLHGARQYTYERRPCEPDY